MSNNADALLASLCDAADCPPSFTLFAELSDWASFDRSGEGSETCCCQIFVAFLFRNVTLQTRLCCLRSSCPSKNRAFVALRLISALRMSLIFRSHGPRGLLGPNGCRNLAFCGFLHPVDWSFDWMVAALNMDCLRQTSIPISLWLRPGGNSGCMSSNTLTSLIQI